MNILVLNGPNLNLTGKRNPAQYGTRSMEQIVLDLQVHHPDICFTYFQSNHEGDLIDRLQRVGLLEDEDTQIIDAVVINPGGLCHTSVSLRDTIEWLRERNVDVVEVHLSHIKEREPFRQNSLLTDVCTETFYGLDAYEKAVSHIESRLLA